MYQIKYYYSENESSPTKMLSYFGTNILLLGHEAQASQPIVVFGPHLDDRILS
jgi:hypothetical protein